MPAEADGTGQHDHAAADIPFSPIAIEAAKATSVGSRTWMPNLKDLWLHLDSSFAEANVAGPTLAAINGDIRTQLKPMQQELGQFIDFKGAKLAGELVVAVHVEGDFVPDDGYAKIEANAWVNDADISRDRWPCAVHSRACYAFAGTTLMQASRRISSRVLAGTSLRVGRQLADQKQTLAELKADVPKVAIATATAPDGTKSMSFDVPQWTATSINMDLAQAWRQFPGPEPGSAARSLM